MAIALKLSNELVESAKQHAAAKHRSVPNQIEHWARLGKAVEENPDMVAREVPSGYAFGSERGKGGSTVWISVLFVMAISTSRKSCSPSSTRRAN
jgi:ParD-like antitoxin of type II bacterial toxin-antitoxin system